MNWHEMMNYTPVIVLSCSWHPIASILSKKQNFVFSHTYSNDISLITHKKWLVQKYLYSVLISISQTLDFQKFYQCCHQQGLSCWGSSVTVNISVTDATDKVIQPHTPEVSSLLWPTISVYNTLRKLRGLSGQGHF